MTRPRRGSDDLPIVIKEAGKAVERDLKPTLNLLGRIFLGGAPPSKSEAVHDEPERAPPSAARLPPSRQIVISQVKRADEKKYITTHIIEAEIIEESGIPRICPTCGGAGRLGRAGHEVPCPSCTRV